MGRVLAAADIGSNTAHLLVAETDGKTLREVENISEWLSLGEIVSRERCIPADSERRLVTALRRFQQMANVHKAESLYLFATEAMRLAVNHEEVMDRLHRALGVKIDLISPEREAFLSLRGVMLDSTGEVPLLLAEVGGGSAQVARYDGIRITHEKSLPLGSGKLIASLGLTMPTTIGQLSALQRLVDGHAESCRSFGEVRRVVASGGVARGFLRALHPDGRRDIHARELEYVAWAASRLSVSEIVLRFRVKPKRAATLVPGAAVFAALLKTFAQTEMLVSEYGVREGAILEVFDSKKA